MGMKVISQDASYLTYMVVWSPGDGKVQAREDSHLEGSSETKPTSDDRDGLV